VSWCCFLLWTGFAIVTVPKGFAGGWHAVGQHVGFALLIFAALGRIWAVVYIAGRKNCELCQTGPYSLTRNPLYFFSFVGVVGFALALQQILLGLIAVTLFLSYYAAVIRGEERILRSLHNGHFEAYCARVPRFWPMLARPLSNGDSVVVHIRPFLSELRQVFWFPAAIILADLLERAHLNQLWKTWTLPF